jgi:hypothetical protein
MIQWMINLLNDPSPLGTKHLDNDFVLVCDDTSNSTAGDMAALNAPEYHTIGSQHP